MKSPMVTNQPYITNKSGYSELQVLQSGAGYYVGTTYWNTDFGGFEEPGSRDSGYFATKEEAQKYLDELESGDEAALNGLRMAP